MTEEQGKPVKEAEGEVKKGAQILRYYAEEGERIYGRIIANEEPDIESRVIYQPVGVAAAISPWNYPIELLAWKSEVLLLQGVRSLQNFRLNHLFHHLLLSNASKMQVYLPEW
jgi:succinate-semialdehyde dehydrogenase / glutarate-semialdehyde dehydrogenase